MDSLFNIYGLPKLNQDQISNLDWSTTPSAIETVIQRSPEKKEKKKRSP